MTHANSSSAQFPPTPPICCGTRVSGVGLLSAGVYNMARRTREGLSKKEIIRCLKRYVAREVYRALLPSHELLRAA